MSTYKLYYFNVTGLGEAIRLLLSYGGQKFDDIRFDKDQWAAIKPNTPMGQVPMLEVDGKKFYQSMAISRFLGQQYGLAGNDVFENLEIDMIAATIDDFRAALVRYLYEPNEEVKNRMKNVALKESLPFFTQRLNQIAGNNNGYLALGRVSWLNSYLGHMTSCLYPTADVG